MISYDSLVQTILAQRAFMVTLQLSDQFNSKPNLNVPLVTGHYV